MAKPIDFKFIEKFEKDSGFLLPNEYKNSMEKENGGLVLLGEDEWELYPILDNTDAKSKAKTWKAFPENGMVIADNGSGNRLVLFSGDSSVYCWNHETGELEKIADSFADSKRFY